MKQLITGFLHGFEFRSVGKWFVLSSLVGVVAGLGAIVFNVLTQSVSYVSQEKIAHFEPAEAKGEHRIFEKREEQKEEKVFPWRIVGVMVAGGLFSGLIVYSLAPEAEGHGTDSAIESFHHKQGKIRAIVPFVKTIASAITLGTAGSGGREGPIAQIGASFGSWLATKLHLSARDRRIMLAAGMGAGVGAIFRAPLAGAIFAGEIFYKDADMESDVIVPSAISSIVAYSVYTLSLPKATRFDPLFGKPEDLQLGSPIELIPLALLAITLVLVGIAYIKIFYGTQKLFHKIPIKPHFRPAIGAGLAGLFAMGLYYGFGENYHLLSMLGTGYGALQAAFSSEESIAISLLLVIAFGKIITTSLTISSGGSGGVFGPSMVIGGCLGGAVGQGLREAFPYLSINPHIYAIVGMAGFFAGCAHAPFSTILMVSEMTGNYSLLLPTMWVSTLCFLLCRRWTLYEKQVPTQADSPAHRGDFIVDVLEGSYVKDVFHPNKNIMLVPENMTLNEIVHKLTLTHQHYFPVVNDAGKMIGIFSSDDVRAYLYDESIWQLAVAEDIMATKIVSLTPDDDLNVALKGFTSLNLDELPVLDPNDPGTFLGMLRRKETIAYYNQQLIKHKQEIEE